MSQTVNMLGEIPARERATIKLSPKTDHRFGGIPLALVHKDQARRALVLNSDKTGRGTTKEGSIDARFFPEDGKGIRPRVIKPREVIEEQALYR